MSFKEHITNKHESVGVIITRLSIKTHKNL